MTGNSLVAAPVDLTTPFSGTFMLESGEALCTAIANGDWVAGGMAAFSLALDGISMALDPIGSLIAMGLGWLMEHIEPLKGWLNDLTGDAGEVAGFASTWQNIATHLQQAGESMEAALRGLASMQGEAADAFRAFHADAARHLAASGDWAGAIGTGMTIASTIVKMVHDMTRDAISTVVGTAASAALTTVVTLGFGAPVAVAQVTSKVASLAARLSKFVTNLLRSVKQLVELTEKLVTVFRRLMTTMANSIRNVPSRTPDVPSTRPGGGTPPVTPARPTPDTRPYLSGNRPSFRNGVPERVWQDAVDASPDGIVRNPYPPYDEISWTPGQPRQGVWDMGHTPEQRYSTMLERYRNGELTPQQFRDWYNDPGHYRPETPSGNRSNRHSDG